MGWRIISSDIQSSSKYVIDRGCLVGLQLALKKVYFLAILTGHCALVTSRKNSSFKEKENMSYI
jgi:hypothetical protein